MKLDVLKKSVMAQSIKSALIAFGCIALYFAIMFWQSNMETKKTTAETTANQSQSEIATLQDKINNAGSAQKQYSAFITQRNNEDFVLKNDKVREILEKLIKRYRVKVVDKLEYSAEKNVEAPELATLSQKFVVRRDTKLKFSAISDVHVLSFIKDMVAHLPGIIRVTNVKIIRKGDLDNRAMKRLASGQIEYLVDAEIIFDWYGMSSTITPTDLNTALPVNGGA